MTDIESLFLSFVCGFAAMMISSYSRWQKQLAINEKQHAVNEGLRARINALERTNKLLRDLHDEDYLAGHFAPGGDRK